VTNEKLFSEFPPISTQQWEDVIKEDLKGADYKKKLVWRTIEGINVKPYYRAEDLKNLKHLNALPGESPYVRGNKTNGNEWEIRQDICVADIEDANKQALEAVERGATSLEMIFGSRPVTRDDFAKLLKGIHFGCIHFSLSTGSQTPTLFDYLIDETKNRGYDASQMNGCIHFDPLGILITSGNYLVSEKEDFIQVKDLIEKAKQQLPLYRVLGVSGYLFRESGSTITQELAFSLAMANEYLSKLVDLGLSIDDVAPQVHFIFSTGSNYFFEIAKIRAFRMLWDTVVKAYNPKEVTASKAYIHCTTQKWNMTVYDPYVNMLRATTESMSAVLGGADSLSVRPFDAPFHKASGFSNRVARNTQIILKEEVYLDRIADPAAGSYYIESLTDSIAAEAWKLFQKVESEGGYSKSFIKGTIQADINTIATKRLNDIATRRETILGTNQYPNFTEQMLSQIDPEVINDKQVIDSTTIATPLKRHRGAEAFEAIRLKTEQSGKNHRVFMLTIGNLAMRLARSQFSSNFFAVAGFEVIDNNGFKTIDDGIKTALTTKADIVVLCSSDDEYANLAPEALEKLAGKAILVVAGAPASQPELEGKGIKNFINIKSNILETLKFYQKELKIE
jgi:methylmalonyl-CoA mutase